MNKYLIRVYPNDDIYIKSISDISKGILRFTNKYYAVLILSTPTRIHRSVSWSLNIAFTPEVLSMIKNYNV